MLTFGKHNGDFHSMSTFENFSKGKKTHVFVVTGSFLDKYATVYDWIDQIP